MKLFRFAPLVAALMFSMPGFSGEVHKVSPDDAAKHLQENVEPSYQNLTCAFGVNVILQIEISDSGDVTSIKAVSGHPILLTAAIDAVRKWHYAPFLVEGCCADNCRGSILARRLVG